jgi:hypothetical protein
MSCNYIYIYINIWVKTFLPCNNNSLN